MHLQKIKLAGFKSFVDPTTLQLNGQLVAVVGPNGCGKSNIIDAVRWVMGESSARHLRGDSMEDVIFSGSGSRKPVGQASVELVFDNSDGSLGGQYAGYAEIVVKRTVERDGQSVYRLNGTRCRRRDITDIFLGTGIGARGYGIIEQGVISRLVEAKPDELRIQLEEVAGISRYRERRRETENRIRHTRENLGRVTDIREEVSRQLNSLKRQARNAERYQQLKQEQRQLEAELTVLRWRLLEQQLQAAKQNIGQQQTALDAKLAQQRRHEAEIETVRQQHSNANEQLTEAQDAFFQVGAQLSRVEQKIELLQDKRLDAQQQLEQLAGTRDNIGQGIQQAKHKLGELDTGLADHEPAYAALQTGQQQVMADVSVAEQALRDWQAAWDRVSERLRSPAQTAHAEEARHEQLTSRIADIQRRVQRVQADLESLQNTDDASEIENLIRRSADQEVATQNLQQQLQGVTARVAGLREQHEQCLGALRESADARSSVTAELNALRAVQDSALRGDEPEVRDWLARVGLDESQALAQNLNVASGWERAAEMILNGCLNALAVNEIRDWIAALDQAPKGNFEVRRVQQQSLEAQAGRMSSKLGGELPVGLELNKIYAVEEDAQAIALHPQLAPGESVISRQGLWLSAEWVKVAKSSETDDSVLRRQQRLGELVEQTAIADSTVEQAERRAAEAKQSLHAAEQDRERLQQQLHAAQTQRTEIESELKSLRRARHAAEQRREQLNAENAELARALLTAQETKQRAELERDAAQDLLRELEAERAQLEPKRTQLEAALTRAQATSKEHDRRGQDLALKVETLRATKLATQESIERLGDQLTHIEARWQQLEHELAHADEPIAEQQELRAEVLEQRLAMEQNVHAARDRLSEYEQHLQQHEKARAAAVAEAEEVRDRLTQGRMQCQEIEVRQQTLDERLSELSVPRADVLQQLPAEAEETEWEQRLEKIAKRIERLGPVNLAAIDESAELEERQRYLDQQHTDISTALTTLEQAIAQIDRDTRARFKDTFDAVNQHLGRLFPRLFGGGRAHLELTETDVLQAGVVLMARPPGKRVASISLLSGGEKALSAIALVFAMFELNPAPFCLLDEVDAPLDDQNVIRYCQLVREMSSSVQFLFITHNKTTMEFSDNLIGVTMSEPGVSRLVTVDVQQAEKLANG